MPPSSSLLSPSIHVWAHLRGGSRKPELAAVKCRDIRSCQGLRRASESIRCPRDAGIFGEDRIQGTRHHYTLIRLFLSMCKARTVERSQRHTHNWDERKGLNERIHRFNGSACKPRLESRYEPFSSLPWPASDLCPGLYTSPHLVAVRERIRINGEPISEELFTKYFFEIWDKLQANTTVSSPLSPQMLIKY